MGKDSKAVAPETYGAVVEQLEGVVQRLEDGELSLEDSLREFEQGIRLVRRGEVLLGEAERRVEQLLHEEGQDRAAPMTVPSPVASAPAAPVARPSVLKRPVAVSDEDDVPF